MIIKNILISGDINLYLETLFNELTKNNISYVYIKESMELHFDNYILRFYTPKIILNTLNEILDDLNDYLNVFGNLEPYLLDNNMDYILEEPKLFINKKRLTKEENRKNNQIIIKQLKHNIKVHRHTKKPK